MFPSDLTDDPQLARSDKLIRWGAVIPWFGLGLIALTAWLLRPSTTTFRVEVLGLSAVGQVLVWRGMIGMRRCRGWACEGVMFYVWLGGLLGATAVASSGWVGLFMVPFVAPAVATVARIKMRRSRTR